MSFTPVLIGYSHGVVDGKICILRTTTGARGPHTSVIASIKPIGDVPIEGGSGRQFLVSTYLAIDLAQAGCKYLAAIDCAKTKEDEEGDE